jgi:hypothetical protein
MSDFCVKASSCPYIKQVTTSCPWMSNQIAQCPYLSKLFTVTTETLGGAQQGHQSNDSNDDLPPPSGPITITVSDNGLLVPSIQGSEK